MSEVAIQWDDQQVTGIVEGSGDTGVLLAHGAGTDQRHPSIVGLRKGLADGGLKVMSFNYPYKERGAKSPDRPEKLLACHKAAADVLTPEVERLFLAGRSMGGRIGTHLVADGYPAAGLILYAYPLHPAGKPDKLRIEHFPDIDVPMLFLQGTKDSLSKMELFEAHIAPLPNATVELMEGAAHGPRGKWTVEAMTERYVQSTIDWIESLSSGGTTRSTP